MSFVRLPSGRMINLAHVVLVEVSKRRGVEDWVPDAMEIHTAYSRVAIREGDEDFAAALAALESIPTWHPTHNVVQHEAGYRQNAPTSEDVDANTLDLVALSTYHADGTVRALAGLARELRHASDLSRHEVRTFAERLDEARAELAAMRDADRDLDECLVEVTRLRADLAAAVLGRDQAEAAHSKTIGELHDTERDRDAWKARHDTLADVSRATIATVERERDEARANYAFMVERAADQKLDGYRELGARAAAAEERAERAERERDEARAEARHLRAVVESLERVRDSLRADLDKANAERDRAIRFREDAAAGLAALGRRVREAEADLGALDVAACESWTRAGMVTALRGAAVGLSYWLDLHQEDGTGTSERDYRHARDRVLDALDMLGHPTPRPRPY